MNVDRFRGKLLAGWQIIRSRMNPGFSQAGEDKIIHYLLSHYLGIEKPSYLDIGTNHPILFNNTYLFYIRGGRGVCVEPDPRFYTLIRRYRRKDVVLKAGIGFKGEKSAAFYVFPQAQSAWNTFSKEEAEIRRSESGIDYQIEQQELLDINQTISLHFKTGLDIFSLDAEGIDFDIIKSLDLEKHRPKVICVETISFSTSGKPGKMQELINYISQRGYFIFADTHINTIFCREDIFQNRLA